MSIVNLAKWSWWIWYRLILNGMKALTCPDVSWHVSSSLGLVLLRPSWSVSRSMSSLRLVEIRSFCMHYVAILALDFCKAKPFFSATWAASYWTTTSPELGFTHFPQLLAIESSTKIPENPSPWDWKKPPGPENAGFLPFNVFFFGGGSFPSTQLLSEQRSLKKEKFPRESRCDWLETRQSLWILLLNPPGSLWWIRLRWRLLRSQKMTSWVTRPKTETSEGSKCHDIFGIVNWILDVKGCVGHDETILWRVFRPINLHKVNSSCLVVWSGMVPVMP